MFMVNHSQMDQGYELVCLNEKISSLAWQPRLPWQGNIVFQARLTTSSPRKGPLLIDVNYLGPGCPSVGPSLFNFSYLAFSLWIPPVIF